MSCLHGIPVSSQPICKRFYSSNPNIYSTFLTVFISLCKWKAVDRPELHHLTDVIVCSTKGPRRAADTIIIGDYDGDKGLLIFQPELVEPFVNAPLHFSKAPTRFEEANFSRHVEKVSSFLTRTSSSPTDVKIQELQKFLLGAIRDSTVGKYSTFHENAIYTKGYCHPTTTRLAYM